MANDPNTTTQSDDPVLVKAKRDAALAEAEKQKAVALKDKAEAERATLAAKIPASQITPLPGSVAVDAAFNIDAKILAHREMAKLARDITTQVGEIAKRQNNTTVVLFDDSYIPLFDQYLSTIRATEFLISSYTNTLSPPAKIQAEVLGEALGMVGGTIKAVADIVALFRSNLDVKGVAVDIQDVALSAELVKGLIASGVKPIYLGSYGAINFQSNNGNLNKTLGKLTELKAQSDQEIIILDKKEKKGSADEIKISKLKMLNGQYDMMMTSIFKNDEKTNTNQFSQLIKVEKLQNILQQEEPPLILSSRILFAGGANISKQSLWGSDLYSTGGAAIAYFLFAPSGYILAAGTIDGKSGPVEFK